MAGKMRQGFKYIKYLSLVEIEFRSSNKTKNSRSNTAWSQLLRAELYACHIILEVEVIVSCRLEWMLIGSYREMVNSLEYPWGKRKIGSL